MSASSTPGRLFGACRCCSPPDSPTRPARRNFLVGGVAALGLAATAPIGRPLPAAAQAPPGKTRIDVHHHFLPQFHRDLRTAHGPRAVGPPPNWSPELSLEDMDRSGIATAILPPFQPGVRGPGPIAIEAHDGPANAVISAPKGGGVQPDRVGLFGEDAPA